jgi:hypothetical protein
MTCAAPQGRGVGERCRAAGVAARRSGRRGGRRRANEAAGRARGRGGGAHRVVLVLDAVADEVLLHQQLQQHGVVDAGDGLAVGLDELVLGVSNGGRREGCGRAGRGSLSGAQRLWRAAAAAPGSPPAATCSAFLPTRACMRAAAGLRGRQAGRYSGRWSRPRWQGRPAQRRSPGARGRHGGPRAGADAHPAAAFEGLHRCQPVKVRGSPRAKQSRSRGAGRAVERRGSCDVRIGCGAMRGSLRAPCMCPVRGAGRGAPGARASAESKGDGAGCHPQAQHHRRRRRCSALCTAAGGAWANARPPHTGAWPAARPDSQGTAA